MVRERRALAVWEWERRHAHRRGGGLDTRHSQGTRSMHSRAQYSTADVAAVASCGGRTVMHLDLTV